MKGCLIKMYSIQQKLISLTRWKKRAVLLLTDIPLVIIALWFSFSLRPPCVSIVVCAAAMRIGRQEANRAA